MSERMELGLRRPADLMPRAAPGHEPELVERIEREIRESGPMTFARFMELALYDPDHGYYVSGGRGPGRTADFLTAPESHPIFGWAVARQVVEVWELLGRPDPFTVREFGAGSGALAAGLVDGLTRAQSPLREVIRYRIAERSPDRDRQVRERLAAVGAADVLEPDDGRPIVGVVLANEVLDALPVHQVRGTADGALVERFVELSADGFRFADGSPSTPALNDRLSREDIRLAPGQLAEVCLTLDGWVAEAAAGLSRGLFVAIDYGHPAPALYTPTRGSLLRAYVNHRVHDDPFANIGRQDLTAHVDLTAVESAAARAGLVHLGTTTQAEFLAGLGAGDLLVELQTSPGVELEGYLEARSAMFRLLDPAATGRFAVLLFGRGIPVGTPLQGLSFRLPARS
ncbi:MAG: SAM-dependent methyltransferase [Chloroflexota bacterium]